MISRLRYLWPRKNSFIRLLFRSTVGFLFIYFDSGPLTCLASSYKPFANIICIIFAPVILVVCVRKFVNYFWGKDLHQWIICVVKIIAKPLSLSLHEISSWAMYVAGGCAASALLGSHNYILVFFFIGASILFEMSSFSIDNWTPELEKAIK